MSRICPQCDSSESVTSGLWLARGFAAATEMATGPIGIIKNSLGLHMRSAVQRYQVTRSIYNCGGCDVYFYTCPYCYDNSKLQSFPTQGLAVSCLHCGERSLLKLD